MAPRRAPPPQPLRLPNSQQSRDPTPAFGKIATYSYRLPPTTRRRWSMRRSLRAAHKDAHSHQHAHKTNTECITPVLAVPPATSASINRSHSMLAQSPGAESAELLRAVALAEVGIRYPFRARQPAPPASAATRSPVADVEEQEEDEGMVKVDIHPATPQLPCPAIEATSRPRDQSGLCADKQSRRTASLHSVLSLAEEGGDEASNDNDNDNDAVEVIRIDSHQGESFYLKPDLTGASGLSIAQFEAHGRSHSSSSTETLVDARPLHLDPTPPTLQQYHVRAKSAPTESSSRTLHAPRRQKLEELFEVPRSYLCPWEEINAPPSPRHYRNASTAIKEKEKEKPLPLPATAASPELTSTTTRRRQRGEWQRNHAVTAALVLLTVLILTDLVALNIRVWSLRDAYYDE
ncbi:hypothetical protein JCM10908_005960 [Rhodotorula pacifica]|uniref:uncharacterized protein n=1 Tax=Rhodotorula pacifica TaxID=1495444 RepID=UPI00316EEC9C